MNINQRVEELKIVPVVKLDRASDAENLAKALVEGGLPVAEVTFRTDAAEESIKIMVEKFPEMLVGAGTITNVKQAEVAINAGAKFLVSPGFNDAVVEYAIERKVPIFPGVCTPTEVMKALDYKLEVVKFFPAENYGGLKTIGALTGPFPQIRIMPTGGIGEHNINEYLANKKIIACGGSWMVKDTLIQEGKFDEIKELTRKAVELVK